MWVGLITQVTSCLPRVRELETVGEAEQPVQATLGHSRPVDTREVQRHL